MQDCLLHDSNKKVANKHVWKLSDYNTFFCSLLVGMQDILSAEFVYILLLLYIFYLLPWKLVHCVIYV